MFLIFLLVIIFLIYTYFTVNNHYNKTHRRWKHTGELKVFLADIDVYYEIEDIAKRAFQEWEDASDKLFTFKFVKTAEVSDIAVYTYKNIPNMKWDETHCGYSSDYLEGQFITKNTITIALNDNITNRTFSYDEIYITMLHEIGHSLGLNHNSNKNAVMYYKHTGLNHLTELDIAELKHRYCITK